MARALKSPSKVVSAQASKGSKKNSDCSANGCQAYGLARWGLFPLSKEKPAGVNRRAAVRALTSPRPDGAGVHHDRPNRARAGACFPSAYPRINSRLISCRRIPRRSPLPPTQALIGDRECCAPACFEGSIMPQSQRLSSVIPFAAIERPACPRCKAQMMLVSIEPGRAQLGGPECS
jgi:hypothetical protein